MYNEIWREKRFIRLGQQARRASEEGVASASCGPMGVASSHTLPLFFGRTKGVRLFLVDGGDRTLDDDDDDRFLLLNVCSVQVRPLVCFFQSKFRSFYQVFSFRWLVFQVTPRVQNPLERSCLLKPDLYHQAEKSGLLFVPGQDIEDRQYQVDVNGLSLSAGNRRFDSISTPPV